MLSTKNSYILYVVVLGAVLTILLFTYGNMIFNELISFQGIGAAIMMFTLFEIVSVWLIDIKSKKISPRKSVNLLLGVKVGKILLTLLFIAVFMFIVKTEQQPFVMVFIVIYLIFLFSNTFYLTRREKVLKTNHTDKSIIAENES
jgi:hypothetical protein